MAWMCAVCGRLKGDYQYSGGIVYNNFVWPDGALSDARRIAPKSGGACGGLATQYDHVAEITKTAQGILDARAKYPESSLADLYDENTMPVELRKAHQANDRAVMKAYGFDAKSMSEAICVAELMKRYAELVGKK